MKLNWNRAKFITFCFIKYLFSFIIFSTRAHKLSFLISSPQCTLITSWRIKSFLLAGVCVHDMQSRGAAQIPLKIIAIRINICLRSSLLSVPRLIEQQIASLGRLLMACNVRCESIEVFDRWRVDFIHQVVVEEKPKAMRLHDGDVMPAVGVAAAVNHHSHKIVHPVGVDCIVGLKQETNSLASDASKIKFDSPCWTDATRAETQRDGILWCDDCTAPCTWTSSTAAPGSLATSSPSSVFAPLDSCNSYRTWTCYHCIASLCC